ncbi:MAG: GtrA family protein [Acutalibacteraceae bacterium]|jgi:putative flippase GtrA
MKRLYDWAVKLPLIRSLMKISIFAKLLSYEVVIYVFFGVVTTVVNLISFKLFNMLLGEGTLFVLPVAGKEIPVGSYLVANVMAWIIAVLFAFVTNKLYVFESKSWERKKVRAELLSFIGARVFSLLIEQLGLILFVELLKVGEMPAKVALAIIVVILNYFFSKFVIFSKKKSTAQSTEPGKEKI